MDAERISDLRRIIAEAPPLPWDVAPGERGERVIVDAEMRDLAAPVNAHFEAFAMIARAALPEALDEIERGRTEIARLQRECEAKFTFHEARRLIAPNVPRA
jgi:hypothetical protein